MPLLEVERVSKVFGRERRSWQGRRQLPFPAVADVSLRLQGGSALAVVGESGAGKTTLAQLVAGLIEPSSGRVRLAGRAATLGQGRRGRLEQARLVQLIWQEALASLNPRQRVAAALAETLCVHRLETRRSCGPLVDQLLEHVGLPAELGRRFPQELSGGEAQRVALARALALRPKLLVCDEPAASLDLRLKLQIVELLARLRRERSVALLIITHDLSLARCLAAELVVMYRGRVVEQGPTVELLKRPAHPYTQLLLAAAPSSADWQAIGGAIEPSVKGQRCGGGCIFFERCPQRGPDCERRQPRLSARGEGRSAACWLPDYQRPK